MRPIVTDGVSWSVGRYVTAVSLADTAEPIEMPFGLWAGVGLRNRALDGVQIVSCEGASFQGKDMPGHARGHFVVSFAKIAEPIEMSFGLWTRMGQTNHVLHMVHIGATW